MPELAPYLLEKSHLKQVREAKYEVALLPWGATEAHNYHLPYGTDTFETCSIAEESARLAWASGAKCVVLPAVPFGVNTGQHDIPGTINMYPSTQAALIHDVLESLQQWEINKFILLNGHGGNEFKQILREAGRKYPDCMLVSANWFQAVDRNDFFDHDGDHADEMETSLMLHLHAGLVRPVSEAGDGSSKRFKIKLLNESWNWTERKWTAVTGDTGIGDPSLASANKGNRFFTALCEKISGLIIQIAKTDPAQLYE